MCLGWSSRRAKRLGSPSERINWLDRSSSVWSDIDHLVTLICSLWVLALWRLLAIADEASMVAVGLKVTPVLELKMTTDIA